jgi:ubiquinone biosynthesis protein
LIDGFFHADPHPGNIFLTDDGRVALLDLGMTGRLSSNMQENLLRLLLAISEGNGDEAVKIVLRISETADDFDEEEFTKKATEFVSEQRNQTLNRQDVGKALMDVSRTATKPDCMFPLN